MTSEAVLSYERRDRAIHLIVRSMTNHELRDVLTGIWATLSAEDRIDHRAELAHYDEYLNDPTRYPDRHLPQLSALILTAYERAHRGDDDPFDDA